jgi:hypothetical protein
MKSSLEPARTTLLLGAGASVPSGAPSSKQLAHKLWHDLPKTEPQSDDLIETASILERRFTRRPVVEIVVSTLRKLRPAGGILGLPQFGWAAIFTTNFDQIVEHAYKQSNIPLTVIRSNYDFSYNETRMATNLYKIHGCISQDRSLGHKASMILTERDYEEYIKYRQSLFALLRSAMMNDNILIIGQSLRDRHLNDTVKEILGYKQEGLPGQVYMLVYDRDDLRALLLEDRGAKIAFGGIDELVHALATDFVPSVDAQNGGATLPLSLVSTVHDVATLKTGEPNVRRMFNGGPATYADIQIGATFERAALGLAIQALTGPCPVAAIVGPAGVGKTTFGRQLLKALSDQGYGAHEHRNDFPFQSHPWLAVEADLRSKGEKAILLLDECTGYLRQTNLLVDYLATRPDPSLRVVLTANAAQWTPRIKSPAIFSHGKIIELSRLDDGELNSLINLAEFNRPVSELVQTEFKRLSRTDQFGRLRLKCGADMFVCLKNIFDNDSLDNILLTEFNELDEGYQEYYRYVAALESIGMRVHRQLVMRMLGLPAEQVATALANLSGIVDEFVINAKEGIYGWSTRHVVIARKITDYKFSSIVELEALFNRIVDHINPAVPVELQSIRDICDAEYGIGRLADNAIRQRLYRKLIDLAPAERIPWHRLVRELLISDSLDEVEYVIRDAVEAVGADAPIDRYRVRLLVARAQKTAGISDGDRVALLRRAYELADRNISRHKHDKHSYRTLCGVALELVQRGETAHLLDEAIATMREGSERILDPEMLRDIRHYEDLRAKLH